MATRNNHGLEPQEEAIMDLWDEGLSRDAIAARLDIGPALVRAVTENMGEGRHDRWALRVPSASSKLAEAIARAYPEMAGA